MPKQCGTLETRFEKAELLLSINFIVALKSHQLFTPTGGVEQTMTGTIMPPIKVSFTHMVTVGVCDDNETIDDIYHWGWR